MKENKLKFILLSGFVIACLGSAGWAATSAPLYSVTVNEGTTKAIDYQYLSGSTKIGFRGTVLLPKAEGEATVKSRQGSMEVSADFKNIDQASKFGNEYLTYVMWAISPDGRATNLGELVLKNGSGHLNVTTQLQTFGLIVTAEPYFAVTQVSDVVVLENTVLKGTKVKIQEVDAKYELLPRGRYVVSKNPADLQPMKMEKKISPYVYQARNAVQLAKLAGADVYASDQFTKANDLLQNVEQSKKKDKSNVIVMARQSIQQSEDARLLAIKKQQDEMHANELKNADQKVADAQMTAQQAEAARQDAESARQTAEHEKVQLRAQLRDQLNKILETRDTARGLIVNMSDVLFQSGKADLKPAMREKLAKISGILLVHSTLKLEVEGHTDSIGSDAYNQTLSEKRAGAVRDYLVSQGISADSIVARGFGKTKPVASNDTAAGRQQNRRVELVVSGKELGTQTSWLKQSETNQ